MEYYEIAGQQLHKAIDLFYEGECICAITLAGASEEVLGQLLEYEKGRKPFVSNLYDNILKEFPDFKKMGTMKYSLNNTRNMLKHFDPDRECHEMKPFDDSVFIILRAISNYVQLRDEITTKMSDFTKDKNVLEVLNGYLE